jgi:hypothetical protein
LPTVSNPSQQELKRWRGGVETSPYIPIQQKHCDEQLVIYYEDPLWRDQIYELLRQVDRERQFHASLATPYERVFVG